uniref:Uncharacterized protein n=1 Tax=Biomphalaria glabrata TaxID=6526 RepID=A0A2C9M0A9_BIOGL
NVQLVPIQHQIFNAPTAQQHAQPVVIVTVALVAFVLVTATHQLVLWCVRQVDLESTVHKHVQVIVSVTSVIQRLDNVLNAHLDSMEALATKFVKSPFGVKIAVKPVTPTVKLDYVITSTENVSEDVLQASCLQAARK